MTFLDTILKTLKNLGDSLIAALGKLLEWLILPLSFLLELLEGIFYLFTKLFDVAVQIVMLFVALFQFLGAIVTGLFRTLSTFLGFTPASYNVNSHVQRGMDVFMEQIGFTGFNTLLPTILIFLVWIGFVHKIIGLFGNIQGGTQS